MQASRKERSKVFRRERRLLDRLESRLLLSTIVVSDSGNITTNGNNLQNAINAANSGDVIILQAGVVYARNITLPNLAFAVGSAPVTIESSAIASLAAGVRVSPAQANLMPKIECTGTAFSYSPGAITAAASSHDFQILGIEMTSVLQTNCWDVFNSLVDLGSNGSNQSLLAQCPTNIIIDRCYVHGTPGYDSKNGIGLNGNNLTISNCYISDIHSTHQDCHAISGVNGAGNYTITNNYLEASTENILFGGAPTYLTDAPTNDHMLIQGNYFYKPLSWSPYSTTYVAPFPNPNYPVSQYTVKNIFEVKDGADMTVTNNVFENNWAGADQFGFAIVFTPRISSTGVNNGPPNAPNNRIANIIFTNNIIRHSGAGVSILGGDGTESTPLSNVGSHDLLIQNNIFEDIGGPQFGAKGGQGFQISCGSHTPYNITIDHNIMLDTYRTFWLILGSANGKAADHITITNNIWNQGLPNTFTVANFSNATISNNLIVGGTGSYPANNTIVASIDAIGMVDYMTERFDLLPTSPFKGAGTGGSDPGISNIAAFTTAPSDIGATGLQGLWHFNESAGSPTAADSSGNNRTGTLAGSPLPTFTTGQTLNGLSFAGTGGYVDVGTFAAPTNLTLTAFIKPGDHTGTNSTILSKGSSEFSMQIQSNGYLQVTIGGVTLTDNTFNYYNAANINKWYLVGATFDSTTDTVTIYRNGQPVVSGANTSSIAESGLNLWIGRDPETDSGSFLGMLDDVRLFNRSLSATEMANIYRLYAPQLDYIDLPNDPQNGGKYPDPITTATGNLNISSEGGYALSHVASSTITYTWSLYSGPANTDAPTYSTNGTTGSRNPTVTFKGPGTYILACTVADPSGVSWTYLTTPRAVILPQGSNFSQYSPIIVAATTTSIVVTPTNAAVPFSTSKQYSATALDQFGNPMAVQPTFTWTVSSGAGSVNSSSGLFTAPASGAGTSVIRATSGAVFGSANANVGLTGPNVVSINRASANPTSASVVNFTVTFSAAVTGVDATDFNLTAAGVSGTSIGTVTGSGTTWTVPVNTGTGSGTIKLNLTDNDSIKDGSGNPLGGTGAGNGNFTAGQTYIIDRTAPVIVLTSPTAGAISFVSTPTITGDAGTNLSDSTSITVKIYAGSAATGAPVQTLSPTADSSTGLFSVNASALASGQYTVQATQADSAGNSANSTPVTFTVDTIGPTITQIYVRSTAWSAAFMNTIASSGKGSATLGYLMPTGSHQLDSLPWSNINQVSLVFSGPVNVTRNLLAVTGNAISYGISGFSVNGNTATWTLNRNVPVDKLLLNLSSAVNDLANNALDGEWTDGVSTVSGNGTPGGNFQYHLRVLPGDANGSGVVDLTDLTMLSGNWQLPTTTWAIAQTDFDGSGTVDLTDLTILSGDWQVMAPAALVAPSGSPSVQVASTTSAPTSGAATSTPAISTTTTPSAGKGHGKPENRLAVLGASSAIRGSVAGSGRKF